jgi:23S rRNA pseudouridine1911/1915/1917 synthase
MGKNKYYDLIHEDEHIVVVNKHLQVLSIPDRFRPDIPNIYNLLQDKYGEIYTVHRLDKDTSGVLCFARTREAHKNLSQQFEKRQTEKIYLALVVGQPYPEEGRIEAALDKHPTKAGLMKVVAKGKPSTTEYKVLEQFKHYSLLECKILTGRMHQIRVHLQHIGTPLAVDPQYGGKEAIFLSEIKQRKFNLSKGTEEQAILSRVPLHALRLELKHPADGNPIAFEAEPPKDIRALLNQLRKWGK